MDETYEYSYDTMRGCSGNTKNDGEYMRWFLATGKERVHNAARAVQRISDGSVLISPSTEEEVRVHLANIRLCMTDFMILQNWFRLKPEIAKHFERAYGECQSVANKAEENLKRIHSLLNVALTH